MRSGARRHAIVFEQQIEAVGAEGANEITWSTLFETRASIEPLSGRELMLAQQVNAEVNTRINVRWRPGIHEALRIRNVGLGELYGILAALPDKTGRREINLLCVKRTAEGWRDGSGT